MLTIIHSTQTFKYQYLYYHHHIHFTNVGVFVIIQLKGNPDNLETNIVVIAIQYCRDSNPWEKVLRQITTEKSPEKCVETNTSSSVVAQNPDERVQMNITHGRNSLNFKC